MNAEQIRTGLHNLQRDLDDTELYDAAKEVLDTPHFIVEKSETRLRNAVQAYEANHFGADVPSNACFYPQEAP